jgi:hypothetical protein
MDLSRIKYLPIIDKESGLVIAKRSIRSVRYMPELSIYVINDTIIMSKSDVLKLELLNSDTNLPILEF